MGDELHLHFPSNTRCKLYDDRVAGPLVRKGGGLYIRDVAVSGGCVMEAFVASQETELWPYNVSGSVLIKNGKATGGFEHLTLTIHRGLLESHMLMYGILPAEDVFVKLLHERLIFSNTCALEIPNSPYPCQSAFEWNRDYCILAARQQDDLMWMHNLERSIAAGSVAIQDSNVLQISQNIWYDDTHVLLTSQPEASDGRVKLRGGLFSNKHCSSRVETFLALINLNSMGPTMIVVPKAALAYWSRKIGLCFRRSAPTVCVVHRLEQLEGIQQAHIVLIASHAVKQIGQSPQGLTPEQLCARLVRSKSGQHRLLLETEWARVIVEDNTVFEDDFCRCFIKSLYAGMVWISSSQSRPINDATLPRLFSWVSGASVNNVARCTAVATATRSSDTIDTLGLDHCVHFVRLTAEEKNINEMYQLYDLGTRVQVASHFDAASSAPLAHLRPLESILDILCNEREEKRVQYQRNVLRLRSEIAASSSPAFDTTPCADFLEDASRQSVQNAKRRLVSQLTEQLSQSEKELQLLCGDFNQRVRSHSEEPCPICFCTRPDTVTECGHVFCHSCAYRIMSSTQQCALCKRTITNLHRIAPSSPSTCKNVFGSKLVAVAHFLRDRKSEKSVVFTSWIRLQELVVEVLSVYGIDAALDSGSNSDVVVVSPGSGMILPQVHNLIFLHSLCHSDEDTQTMFQLAVGSVERVEKGIHWFISRETADHAVFCQNGKVLEKFALEYRFELT